MNRKGIVVTVSVLLLAMAVLGLVQAIKYKGSLMERGTSYSSMLERVSYKHENLEDNILDIVVNIGGVSMEIGDTNIGFKEMLPERKNRNSCNVSIRRYQEFVKMFPDNVDVNITQSDVDLCTLNIMPYDINYGHWYGPGKGNTKGDTLYYKPEDPNDINAYFLDITLQNQDYEGTLEDLEPCDADCNHGIYLVINIFNSYKIEEYTKTYYLDPEEVSEIDILTSGNANKDVIITLGPGGELKVVNNNSVSVYIESGIDFGDNADEQAYLGLPEGFLWVSNTEFGAEKH